MDDDKRINAVHPVTGQLQTAYDDGPVAHFSDGEVIQTHDVFGNPMNEDKWGNPITVEELDDLET